MVDDVSQRKKNKAESSPKEYIRAESSAFFAAAVNVSQSHFAYSSCSWDVFAYESLPNPLRPVGLPLGRLSSGQRQPITLRLQLVFLGRFRIRTVIQSAARFALAFLGRFRIRAVAQSAARFALASWTVQHDYTRCRLGSQGTKLHIVVYPQEKHPLSTGGKGCFRKIFKAFERGEKFFQKSYAQAAAIPSPARLCARGTGCRCPPRGSGASKP